MPHRKSILAIVTFGALALLTAASAIADVRHDAHGQAVEVRGEAATPPDPVTPTIARFELVPVAPQNVAVAEPAEPLVLRDRVAVRRAHAWASRARS